MVMSIFISGAVLSFRLGTLQFKPCLPESVEDPSSDRFSHSHGHADGMQNVATVHGIQNPMNYT